MESPESYAPQQRDVSSEFQSLNSSELSRFLREIPAGTKLEVSIDLSAITDPMQFKIAARRVKAFVESGQNRKASIRASREQVMWEPNVFSSAVDLIPVE